jgi:hypothetical protein
MANESDQIGQDNRVCSQLQTSVGFLSVGETALELRVFKARRGHPLPVASFEIE